MTIDFRSLPKVSLHDHLDGGLRPQTIIELSAEVGHTLPNSASGLETLPTLDRWCATSKRLTTPSP